MEPTCTGKSDLDDEKQDVPLLLSGKIVAERLGISMRTLWRLRAAGKLPAPVRLGGSVRWRVNEIDSWVAAGCPIKSR
jgi:prophage regulatory protein